jgi:hypothetical protein
MNKDATAPAVSQIPFILVVYLAVLWIYGNLKRREARRRPKGTSRNIHIICGTAKALLEAIKTNPFAMESGTYTFV